MNRTPVILILLASACALFWCFPLFRIVRLDEREASRYEAAFNAAEFAEIFWRERLAPSLEHAADADAVLAAFRDNPQLAREEFGRKIGVSRTRLFVLHGSGTVVSVARNGVGVKLDEGDGPDVVLHTGLLFGNTVRDATGLLNAGDFPNSQHFNEISTELNRIVEEQVISVLSDKAAAGRKIRFVGCAEVRDDASDLRALTIVPLEVDIE